MCVLGNAVKIHVRAELHFLQNSSTLWIGEDSGSDEDDEEADAEAKEKTEGEAEYMYERVADSSESDDIDARLKVLFELENGGSSANSKLKTGKTEGSFSSEFSMASDISACYDITAEVIEEVSPKDYGIIMEEVWNLYGSSMELVWNMVWI